MAKPLAKDARRVPALTEVWRITDESGELYFKNPHDLRVADDGMIFLADEEQLIPNPLLLTACAIRKV